MSTSKADDPWEKLREDLLAATTPKQYDEVIYRCQLQRNHDMSAELQRLGGIHLRVLSKLQQVKESRERGVPVFDGTPNDVATRILEFVLNG